MNKKNLNGYNACEKFCTLVEDDDLLNVVADLSSAAIIRNFITRCLTCEIAELRAAISKD